MFFQNRNYITLYEKLKLFNILLKQKIKSKVFLCSLQTEILTHFTRKTIFLYFLKTEIPACFLKKRSIFLYSLKTEILTHFIRKTIFFYIFSIPAYFLKKRKLCFIFSQNRNSGAFYKKV